MPIWGEICCAEQKYMTFFGTITECVFWKNVTNEFEWCFFQMAYANMRGNMPRGTKIYAIFWGHHRASFLGKNSKHRNIHKWRNAVLWIFSRKTCFGDTSPLMSQPMFFGFLFRNYARWGPKNSLIRVKSIDGSWLYNRKIRKYFYSNSSALVALLDKFTPFWPSSHLGQIMLDFSGILGPLI